MFEIIFCRTGASERGYITYPIVDTRGCKWRNPHRRYSGLTVSSRILHLLRFGREQYEEPSRKLRLLSRSIDRRGQFLRTPRLSPLPATGPGIRPVWCLRRPMDQRLSWSSGDRPPNRSCLCVWCGCPDPPCGANEPVAGSGSCDRVALNSARLKN